MKTYFYKILCIEWYYDDMKDYIMVKEKLINNKIKN